MSLIRGNLQKSYGTMSREYGGVDGSVGCGIWPKSSAQIGPSVPLLCRDEFAMCVIAIFLGG